MSLFSVSIKNAIQEDQYQDYMEVTFIVYCVLHTRHSFPPCETTTPTMGLEPIIFGLEVQRVIQLRQAGIDC